MLLDVAGLHGVDCLPDGYAITPEDLQKAAGEQGVTIQPKSVVLVRTGRMTKWPDFDGYLLSPPGIGLPAAKWLCEEVGAMCIGGDSIALEVLPSEEPDVFLPVHCYMFATAGAQIIEVVDMEEIAAEKQYEFAFLGFPLKLRGATGAPIALLRGAAEELGLEHVEREQRRDERVGHVHDLRDPEVDARRCRARRPPGRAKPYVASRWSIISTSASRAAAFRSIPPSTGMPVVANERRAGRPGVSNVGKRGAVRVVPDHAEAHA